eukprot:CAMPEP_0182443852 /NCGR_PEP_ID=MMETSP1172-20130603/2476_1 /TAXON_ID=708627 /ORGANISM="Timspurckia oligopyrenoides, Strain CCMP3278" /LENGTH=776 /DNA_ID=CAMNT_0024639251 /DNA_START=435 /DNA_END=2765 /DNA_ORIENTATION=+
MVFNYTSSEKLMLDTLTQPLDCTGCDSEPLETQFIPTQQQSPPPEDGNRPPPPNIVGSRYYRLTLEFRADALPLQRFIREPSTEDVREYSWFSGVQIEIGMKQSIIIGCTMKAYVNRSNVPILYSSETRVISGEHYDQVRMEYNLDIDMDRFPDPKAPSSVFMTLMIELIPNGLKVCTTSLFSFENEEFVFWNSDETTDFEGGIRFTRLKRFIRDETNIKVVEDSFLSSSGAPGVVAPGAFRLELGCAKIADLQESGSSKLDWWVYLVIGLCSAIVIVGVILVFVLWRRRKKSGTKDELSIEDGLFLDSIDTDRMEKQNSARDEEGIYETPTRTGSGETGKRTASLVAFEQVIISRDKVIIGELIGKGGFASVHKGFYGGEQVAIKILRRATQDVLGKSVAQTYFETHDVPKALSSVTTLDSSKYYKTNGMHADVLQEIAALERCRHPHVAHFYGICLGDSESDSIWLVMELASRGTLQDLLISSSLDSFTWIDRQRMCYFVSLGMEYLHSAPRNIFHADLKPANIILSDSMLPKVIDFGIAAFYTDADAGLNARKRGTLMYMAPEILIAENGNELQSPEKADVYSFGMLMFVLAHQTEFGQLRELDMDGLTKSKTNNYQARSGIVEMKQDNTVESFLDGFELQITEQSVDEAAGLNLLMSHQSAEDAEEGIGQNIESRRSFESGDSREYYLNNTFTSTESMVEYFQHVNDVLFHVSKTTGSYLDSVLCFRRQHGFQMKVAPGCPETFAYMIQKCTQYEPQKRPTFSQLSAILKGA